MLISIVTGTYQRIKHLTMMMDSARAQIPRHIEYEFVIVDGGSTDGTIEYLKSCDDVRLIEHGELKGAIKAFSEGARAAQGEYVLIANDDIEFMPYAIMPAVVHLQETPRCGVVAFADDRAAQMGQGTGYQVLGMPAVNPNNKRVHVNYAQVGLFRKWIGDYVGWWGDMDKIMSRARTYGGDNFLSSGIWELGYSVDAVKGCNVKDHIPRDELRHINNKVAQNDSMLYYQRYPQGAMIPATPKVERKHYRYLRILVLPIYEPAFPGRENKEYGLSEALAQKGLTWEHDYVNESANIIDLVDVWKPDVMLTQFHDATKVNAAVISRCLQVQPDMWLVNWNGDAHEAGLTSPRMMELLKYYDLQTVVNAKVLPVYKSAGIHAAYWQIAYKDPVEPYTGKVPKHDVVFLGNCYNDLRHKLVKAIRSVDKKINVGVYGFCEDPDGNTHYSFAKSRALYEHCKIAISDTFPDTQAFVSNRLFQALSAGAFVLQQHSPDLDKFTGLIPGKHYIEWKDTKELKALIKAWVTDARTEDRRKIAACGKRFVRENYSYDAQIDKLWDLLPG